MNTFSGALRSFYSNYANFSGRANRPAYWWVALYIAVVSLVLSLLAGSGNDGGSAGYWIFTVILWLFGLFNLIPNLALTVRRLHDTGKGGGWIFIALVPFIGEIWLLILMLLPSQQGPNRFGDMP